MKVAVLSGRATAMMEIIRTAADLEQSFSSEESVGDVARR
jgi:hypothetical protein